MIGEEPGNTREDPILQRKLYRKSKAEPAFRFYLLYDKICRAALLEHAYALARTNGGCAGGGGESFAAIEAAGLEEWLAGRPHSRREDREHQWPGNQHELEAGANAGGPEQGFRGFEPLSATSTD